MSTGTGALLFLASMLCFAVGFGVAWVRARRRVQARIHDRLRQEMEQRMAEEVLRRLRDGKLHDDIAQTLNEQGYSADGGEGGQASGASSSGSGTASRNEGHNGKPR